MRSRIDLERLALEIKDMTNNCALFRVLRKELKARERWKELSRGKNNNFNR